METYFRKHPDKRPRGSVTSTALWRGYIAVFEFRENTLVLKDIDVEGVFGWRSVKNKVVPNGKVLEIDWFTGILEIPIGELVQYAHSGYSSTYNDYILLEIRKGKLTGTRRFNYEQYEQFKERQFQAYKKTDAYKLQVAELRKEDKSQENIDFLLRHYIMNYALEFLDDGDGVTSSGETFEESK